MFAFSVVPTKTCAPLTVAPVMFAMTELSMSLVEIAADRAAADHDCQGAGAAVDGRAVARRNGDVAAGRDAAIGDRCVHILAHEIQIDGTTQSEGRGPRAPDRNAHEHRIKVDGDRHARIPEVERVVRARELGRRAETRNGADIIARGHRGVGDGGAHLVKRGRIRRAGCIRVGGVERAANVVVRDRGADGGPVHADGNSAGNDGHHRRLECLKIDRALGALDGRVADVGVDVVVNQVDGHRTAQREPVAGPRPADGDGDQHRARGGCEIQVAGVRRHAGVVDVRQDRVVDQVVADRRADRGALRGPGDAAGDRDDRGGVARA